jgi:hypothetical protein
MNLASATLCGTTMHSAAGWPEPLAAVMVVQHGTREFLASLMGYAASAAVLATFLMRKMVPLRMIAILSNVLFVSYGYAEHIYPVLCLHIALLPINAYRLVGSLDRFKHKRGLRAWAFSPGISSRHALLFALGLLSGTAGGLIFMRILSAVHV